MATSYPNGTVGTGKSLVSRVSESIRDHAREIKFAAGTIVAVPAVILGAYLLAPSSSSYDGSFNLMEKGQKIGHVQYDGADTSTPNQLCIDSGLESLPGGVLRPVADKCYNAGEISALTGAYLQRR